MALGISTTVNIEGADRGTAAQEPCVVVLDAHELIASSLVIALRHAGFERVSAVHPDAVDLGSANGSVELSPGDIVLIGLLYGDGRTTLPFIRPLVERGCRVLVMASDQGLPLTGDCLDRGAETVLDKGMSLDRLAAVLRRLSAGGCAMTEAERAALLESVQRHESAQQALQQPFQSLTEREADVLAALVAGKAPKQIAHHNGITVSTVRGHIQRVLSKLEVSSQREALAMARHAGWP
ncbi:MAG TPA: response regulator transcription factor [Acidimicrobiales bacterium]|nr:response regulator transcription factor [Acidimicrobiales bacterium]